MKFEFVWQQIHSCLNKGKVNFKRKVKENKGKDIFPSTSLTHWSTTKNILSDF